MPACVCLAVRPDDAAGRCVERVAAAYRKTAASGLYAAVYRIGEGFGRWAPPRFHAGGSPALPPDVPTATPMEWRRLLGPDFTRNFQQTAPGDARAALVLTLHESGLPEFSFAWEVVTVRTVYAPFAPITDATAAAPA